MATKKDKAKVQGFGEESRNRDVFEKTFKESSNYEGVMTFNMAVAPEERYARIARCLFRENVDKDRNRITLAEYCHTIYGWLIANTRMLSVSDYYDFPKDNAPFIYTLDEVLEFDSDEIYNLLQERIAKMMMRKQLDRDSCLAVLREKFGWQRDENDMNLNANGNIRFEFGETLSLPTQNNSTENSNNYTQTTEK